MTFLLVCFGWVLFRSSGFPMAGQWYVGPWEEAARCPGRSCRRWSRPFSRWPCAPRPDLVRPFRVAGAVLVLGLPLSLVLSVRPSLGGAEFAVPLLPVLMSAYASIRRLTRAGILLRVSSRFSRSPISVPVSFRCASSPSVPGRRFARRRGEAPFLPGRRGAWTTFGDLANSGGVPYPADYRREDFTTDASGFRNSGNMAGSGPVGAIVLGDSFVAGAGLSDDQTLAARLREAAGTRVFNAGGLPVWNLERLDAVLALSGLAPGGTAVYGLSEAPILPVAPSPRRATPGRRPTAPVEGGIGFRASAWDPRGEGRQPLAGFAHLSPGGNVVRRPLANGDVMLFQSGPPRASSPSRRRRGQSWAGLRDALGPRGIGLLVLLIPRKDEVYGDSRARAVRSAGRISGGGEGSVGPRRAGARPGAGPPAAARGGLAARRYVYWRDDTHWSPLGVQIAAAELSSALAGASPTARKAADGT